MENKPQITLYGAYWCPDCHRSKQFLGEHQIPYNWVDIEEDSEGEAFVIKANNGKRRIPTLSFDDGSLLSAPSNAELAKKLKLKTTASRSHYDLIIIGGGPAGLTSAIYTTREGIDTLIIERAAIGGQAASTMHLDNVPGFHEGIEGTEFAKRLRAQAERFGVEFLQAQSVNSIQSPDNYHCVTTEDGSEYSCRALLIATGSKYKSLGVDGEDDFLGAGVHFCATCDGPFYKNRPVVVVGGGNSAVEEAMFLKRFASDVTLLVRGDSLSASQIVQDKLFEDNNIDVQFNTVIEKFEGEKSKLKNIYTRNRKDNTTNVLNVPGAFIFIGLEPNTKFLKDSPLALDNYGFLMTGHEFIHTDVDLSAFASGEPSMLETNIPGIFAAGDVRAGSTKQVASAAGEGAAVALTIREYLKQH